MLLLTSMVNYKVVSAVVVAIGVVVFTAVFVGPKYQEIQRLQMDIIAKQSNHANDVQYQQKILAEVAQMKENQEAINKVDSALPDTFSLASLMYFLQQKGIENGLTMKSVLFSAPTPVGPGRKTTEGNQLQSVAITLDVAGGYVGFKRFLSALDNSAKLFEVDSISFASPQSVDSTDKTKTAGAYDFRVEAKTFAY